MPDIGYYTLPVIPSFRGIEGRVNRDLDRAFGASGTRAGRALTTNASREIARDRSIEKATAAKSKAMDNLTRAMDRSADAAGRVRVAEANLAAARKSGNEARIVSAEERLATARRRTATETRQLAAANREVTTTTRNLDQAVRGAQQNMQNAASGGDDGGTGAGMAGLMFVGRGGLSALTGSMGRLGSVAGVAARAGIVGAVTVGIGAALAAPVAAGFKLFNWGAEVGLPLERQMNTLSGVTNATKVEMAAAGAEARRLGSDIQLSGVTAADAASAMTELAKGGLSLKDAMAATRGTVQLATAGQLDAAEAAQYQTAAMNMFGVEAGKATHVADLLAGAANASSAEVRDIGMALQQGGSVAAGFGLSIEETVGVLTAFSRMGINASDAGTMLKTSLQAITDQGNPAQGAIDELGLTLYDATGKFVGYNEMMKQVAEASTRMTEEQFQAATATLFGSDAMRASMIAAKGGPQLFDDTAKAMANVDGAASRMAASQMQGLPGVIEGVSNTVDAMKLSVYDAGNAIATALGQQALGGLDSLAEAVRRHQPQIVGFFTGVGTFAVEGATQIVMFAAESTRALAQLVNVVGDFHGGMTRAMAATKRFFGDTEAADKLDAEADAAFGWGDGLYRAADGLDATVTKLRNFKGELQTAGDRANEAAKMTVALGDAVASVPDGKDIIITNTTPQTIADLEALGIAIEETPTGLKITAETDEAARIVNAWRQQQGLEPVDVTVKPAIDPAAAANVDAFFAKYKSMPVPMNPNVPTVTPAAPGTTIADLLNPPRADGGLWTSYGFGKMPTKPIIQPPTRGLVQWAEPSTHGEAFIPLNPGNRERSTKIWAETGKRLGALRSFAAGGLTAGANFLKSTLQQMFPQITEIGGYRPPDGYNEHSSGNALDVMVPDWQSPGGKALGDTVAAFALRNADALGLTYLIWQQRIFRPGDTTGTPMGDRGSPTQNHLDHVHIWTNERGGALPTAPLIPVGQSVSTAINTGGATAIGPGGKRGSYVVDQDKVARAEQDVIDADARVALEEQQIRELEADAKESQKMAAQDQLRRAKVDAADARKKLEETKRGDFEEADDPTGSSGTGSGESQFGEVGSIFSSFLKDTFGLGDLLPDPSQLGIVKLLGAIMGIKYTPQGDGRFPWEGGGPAPSASPFGPAAADPLSTLTSMLPFGMGDAISGITNQLAPGTEPPPMPVGAHGPGGSPGPGNGAQPVPQNVDQSTHVTVQGYSSNDVTNKVRRELQWAPRTQTYAPPGA